MEGAGEGATQVEGSRTCLSGDGDCGGCRSGRDPGGGFADLSRDALGLGTGTVEGAG